jgi:hypothetical protein
MLSYFFSLKTLHTEKNLRSRILKKISPKNIPLRSGIQDPGSGKNSSRIRIPDPGGKKAPDPGSRILDPDPQHWMLGSGFRSVPKSHGSEILKETDSSVFYI